MRDYQRWKQAQTKEKESWVHDEIASRELTEKTLSKGFDTELKDFTGQSILAVGSGTGRIHNLSFDCFAVGIDPLSHSYFNSSSGSNAHVFTGIGEHLPFQDETFDSVWTFNVIDHMIEPEKALREICRVLKPEGELYLMVHCFSLPDSINKILDYFDRLHPHHFSIGELSDMIDQSGFNIQSSRTAETEIKFFDRPPRNSLKLAAAKYVFRIRETYVKAVKYQ